MLKPQRVLSYPQQPWLSKTAGQCVGEGSSGGEEEEGLGCSKRQECFMRRNSIL